ncbi:trichome birefringence-like protein 3 [Tanacetum coccineum]
MMGDDEGVFYFKFATSKGLEQVLEHGPWLIRNVPLILKKWTPKMTISKDQVTRVPVWVKFHKVPVVAYSEDGLSLIATQVGTPIMLDAFTSDNLRNWVRVEYEWKPPVCVDFKVFGHASHQCPKRIPTKVVPTEEIHDDGFTVVKNRKAKGKNVATIQRGNFNGGIVRGLNCATKQSKVPQVVNENQLSVCAILEFHVDISTLAKNVDIVYVMVLAQSIQALLLWREFVAH